MNFSLNWAGILGKMANEQDETLEDLEIDWRKVIEEIYKGRIDIRTDKEWTGYFLVIDIPDELIKRG